MPLTRSRTLKHLANAEAPGETSPARAADMFSLRRTPGHTSDHKRARPSTCNVATQPAALIASSAGLLGLLGDDALLLIMHKITRLPSELECSSLCLRAVVLEGARRLRALQLSCRFARSVLVGFGAALHREMIARASTHVAPARNLGDRFPFTGQMEREQRSSRQLSAFQDAIASMAVHCAGPCCAKAHSEFARRGLQRRITPAARRSTVLAAPPSGECAFIASRHRGDGFRMRGRGPRSLLPDGRMTSEWILRVARRGCKELNALQLTDLGQFSPAHSMRVSQCGTATTLVRSVYASHVDDTMPHSVVMVWNTEQAPLAVSDVLEPPTEAEGLGAINAQDAWWVGPDASRLAVLWSTGYVHPMGSVVGANANSACYFACVYRPSGNGFAVDTYVGPFQGKVQTASPTRDGYDVAVLVRKRPMGAGPGSLATATRCTMMHNIYADYAVELTHSTAIAYGRGALVPPHPHDQARCPSAVALSPSGDCVVAVHRRALTVILEVLLRTAPNVFVSVQRIDISHWTSLGRGEATIFDEAQDSSAVAMALKLPYTLTFSPCGRFVAVVDQRPLFGLAITNHSVVVLDMSRRHERRGVRALPLAPAEDVAPRSLEWTTAGLWVQPRYGCVLLESE